MAESRFLAFLRLFFRKWSVRILYLLGLLSTAATFIQGLIFPPWVVALCLVPAPILAAYDIFCHSVTIEAQLQKCEKQLEIKPVSLMVYSYPEKTEYVREFDRQRGEFVGIYIQMNMAIENRGPRDTTLMYYTLTINEINRTYERIAPQHRNTLQCTGGANSAVNYGVERNWIDTDGIVRVDGNRLVGPALLPFYVKDIPPQTCREIHCGLKIEDTSGNSVTHQFVVPERTF